MAAHISYVFQISIRETFLFRFLTFEPSNCMENSVRAIEIYTPVDNIVQPHCKACLENTMTTRVWKTHTAPRNFRLHGVYFNEVCETCSGNVRENSKASPAAWSVPTWTLGHETFEHYKNEYRENCSQYCCFSIKLVPFCFKGCSS